MKKAKILCLVKASLDKLQSTNSSNNEETIGTAVHGVTESDLTVKSLCTLWSGMGHIYKVTVKRRATSKDVDLVIKHVAPPATAQGQQQSLGDRRKTDSYVVETNFYEHVAATLIQEHGLLIPQPYYIERKANNEILIVMEYIDSQSCYMSEPEMHQVLDWLATLHAAYWGNAAIDELVATAGLQETGSYWYLETRPDEHASMPNAGWQGRLKRAAHAIDARLKRDPLQCLIHGDAKDANVMTMFTTPNGNGKSASNNGDSNSDSSNKLSSSLYMCDFQYTGKGPPTKDLAYFFCTSAAPDDEDAAVDYYLNSLTSKLAANVKPPSRQQLDDSLDLAYCDFYRFMSGWGFWGSGGEDRVKAALDRLDGGKDLGSEEAYDKAVRREYG